MLKNTREGGPKSFFSVYARNNTGMHDADKQYLADHYYDFLAIALRILQSEEDARDAVQEALALTMARPWVNDAYSYCCKVVRNQCWDRLKERYIVRESQEIVDETDEPDTVYERRIELLRKLKGQLPQETVLLLDMHYGRGLTIEEMAESTGRTQTWVRKKIVKALHRLRAEILNEETKQNEI